MNNNNANVPPAGSSGADSLTDTLKGYINVAMVKGHEALETAKVLGHKAQVQLNDAVTQAQAQVNQSSTGHANDASGNTHAQTQYNSTSAYPGQQQPQSTANDAFSDLNQFNNNANKNANNANNAARNAANQASSATNRASNQASNAAHNAAANPGYKSSQGGL